MLRYIAVLHGAGRAAPFIGCGGNQPRKLLLGAKLQLERVGEVTGRMRDHMAHINPCEAVFREREGNPCLLYGVMMQISREDDRAERNLCCGSRFYHRPDGKNRAMGVMNHTFCKRTEDHFLEAG